MTNPDLAALSEAANHNTPEGHKAYEMFCAAAWNEYRAGRLVHIDKGMRERVAALVDAVEDAGRGYSINLVRLVDGVSTYTLTYRGEVTEHESHSDALDALRELARQEKIDAAIAAMMGGAK